MPSYSVAEAKNSLPRLIDRAIAGEEVVITRHGKVVAEVTPKSSSDPKFHPLPPYDYEALRKRREARGPSGMTSVELLNAVYEDYRF